MGSILTATANVQTSIYADQTRSSRPQARHRLFGHPNLIASRSTSVVVTHRFNTYDLLSQNHNVLVVQQMTIQNTYNKTFRRYSTSIEKIISKALNDIVNVPQRRDLYCLFFEYLHNFLLLTLSYTSSVSNRRLFQQIQILNFCYASR